MQREQVDRAYRERALSGRQVGDKSPLAERPCSTRRILAQRGLDGWNDTGTCVKQRFRVGFCANVWNQRHTYLASSFAICLDRLLLDTVSH